MTVDGDVRQVTPDTGAYGPMVIEVPPEHPFVMVMRDDTSFCAETLGPRLAADTLDTGVADDAVATEHAVAASYRYFQQDVRGALRDAITHPNGVEFHLVNADELECAVRRRAGEGTLVSLDPLIRRAVVPLEVSRGFLLGGACQVGLVARPGARPIAVQLGALDPGSECTLIEDDICSGGTVTQVVGLLREAGVRVTHVVPGVRLPSAREIGAVLDPVIEYRMTGGAPNAVGLADPRNFLLGVSGLVVRLPAKGWGRAPYWLPFVSTAARIGIDSHYDRPFALAMIDANARFFARIERSVRRPIRVRHLHPAVRRLLASLGIAWDVTPMSAVLESLAAHLDRYTEELETGPVLR